MDQFERECRMELEFCKLILNSIEKSYRKSTRSQKVISRSQKHLEILWEHQLELRKELTEDI